MEEALLRFAEHHSPRYVPTPDGNWTCPPGGAYAQSVGLSYWLRSSRETNPVYFDNLRFLEEYLIGTRAAVRPETVTVLRSLVMRQPGMDLRDLLRTLGHATADDVYALLKEVGALPCVLGGLSMGGYVALAFARKYCKDLKGLILIDTRSEAYAVSFSRRSQ